MEIDETEEKINKPIPVLLNRWICKFSWLESEFVFGALDFAHEINNGLLTLIA